MDISAPNTVPDTVATSPAHMTADSESESSAPGLAPSLAQIDDSPGKLSIGGIAVIVLLAAALLSGLGVYAYFHFGQKKAVATGTVAHLALYPMKATIGGRVGGGGMAGADQSYTQLLVFAQVKVHNQSADPLTITEMVGDVTLPDTELHGDGQPSSPAASHNDFNRLFGAYKKLAPFRSEPLLRDTAIAPGQTVEGLMVFNYSMTEETWAKRKSFLVSVSFSNGTTIQIDASHL